MGCFEFLKGLDLNNYCVLARSGPLKGALISISEGISFFHTLTQFLHDPRMLGVRFLHDGVESSQS